MDFTKLKKYKAVGNFCNQGFAVVYSYKDGFNFINRDGNEKLSLGCSYVKIFRSGIIELIDKRMGVTRYVDFSFNEIPSFGKVYEFQSSRGLSRPIIYKTCAYSGRIEDSFDLDFIPKDGTDLQIPDYYPENFSRVYLSMGNNKECSLIAQSGELLVTGQTLTVLAKKGKNVIVHRDNQLVYVSIESVKTLNLPSYYSPQYIKYYPYEEHGPFVIFHNVIWCNGTLVPIYGWDDYVYNAEDKTLTIFQCSRSSHFESQIPEKAIKIIASTQSKFRITLSDSVYINEFGTGLTKHMVSEKETVFTLPIDSYVNLKSFKTGAEVEYQQTLSKKSTGGENKALFILVVSAIILMALVLFDAFA